MSTATIYALYLVLTAGVAAIYFLMPRLDRSRPSAGAIFGLCALVGLLVLLAFRGLVESRGAACFYVCTFVALGAGVRVITHTKPVYSAVYFVLLVIAVAGLLLLQAAEFLAAALVIIYAGAILVTYLFVIMLAQQSQSPVYDRSVHEPILALLAGFVLAAAIAARAGDLSDQVRHGVAASPPSLLRRGQGEVSLANPPVSPLTKGGGALASDEQELGGLAPPASNSLSVGALIMTKYVVALEIAGLLLLVSMVGAIALSRKKVPIEPYLGAHVRLGLLGKEVEPF